MSVDAFGRLAVATRPDVPRMLVLDLTGLTGPKVVRLPAVARALRLSPTGDRALIGFPGGGLDLWNHRTSALQLARGANAGEPGVAGGGEGANGSEGVRSRPKPVEQCA